MAKPAREFSHALQIFLCLQLRKQSISEEINHNNDIKFAWHDQIVAWAGLATACELNRIPNFELIAY